MKTNNPLSEQTEELLRAPLPESRPRPGFETRLMASLEDAPKEKRPAFGFLAAGAAVMALLLFVFLRPGPESAPPPVVTSRPVLQVEALPNPLAQEADAVRSTVTKAGRFLISQFPSIPAEEELEL